MFLIKASWKLYNKKSLTKLYLGYLKARLWVDLFSKARNRGMVFENMGHVLYVQKKMNHINIKLPSLNEWCI